MTTTEALTRGVVQVLPNKGALSQLMNRKKIRVYLGIDPTGPKLHLGHTIPLKKLQAFADLGHEAILVFGTGTVLAGDPSQRKEARGAITQKEIDNNISDWKRQAQKVLDFDKIRIEFNGDWLLKLTIPELIKIESFLSATQLFKREMFQERLSRGDFVGYHETLYPVLQGYDSVHLNVDAEIGGTDQTFNMLIGRELQKKINNREKFVITTPLISGTDGQPMSKSSGNCIWLDDTEGDMYGKIMSTTDSQIAPYWENLTNLPKSQLETLKPFEAKKLLAHEIVKIYHGANAALTAQKDFEKTFQKGQIPKDITEIRLLKPRTKFVDFLVKNNLVQSKSEAKRLLTQNAIEVDDHVVNDPKMVLSKDQTIKIGKKKFVRVVLS